MQESLEVKGVWFLPENNTDQCFGELNFSPSKGITLKLFGRFENTKRDHHEPIIINGIIESGKKITVYKCYQIASSFNTASFETITYDAIYLFVGRSCLSLEELQFTHIRAELADLSGWLGKSGFEFPKRDKDKYAVEYALPESISYSLLNDLKWTFQYLYHQESDGRVKLALGETCSIFLTTSITKTFDELFNIFQSANRLMTLAYFQRPLTEKLFVGVKKSIGSHEYYDEVQVYHQTETTNENYRARKSSQYFLFTYKEVQTSFEDILTRWFRAETEMQPTLAAMAEAFMRRDSPMEFVFLNLAQALETFHRRTNQDGKYDTDQHRQKLSEILNSVNLEYKSWLRERLEFSHEPTFQRRLEALADMVPKAIHSQVFKPTTSKFLMKVKNSRNYYTHYNARLKDKAATGGDLFDLSERMKIFLVAVILKYLQFTDEQTIAAICNKGAFLFNHIIRPEDPATHKIRKL